MYIKNNQVYIWERGGGKEWVFNGVEGGAPKGTGKKGGRASRKGWGFDPLKGISKYINFKGSKGRGLL